MPTRTSTGTWHGSLKEGTGTLALGSGVFEGPYTFAGRFEEGTGTNPEELIGAALASCYSMFLANLLASAGSVPDRVHTEARVHLGRDDGGPVISKIELTCRAEVPGIEPAAFAEHAAAAKANCPVSKALRSVNVELDAQLVQMRWRAAPALRSVNVELDAQLVQMRWRAAPALRSVNVELDAQLV